MVRRSTLRQRRRLAAAGRVILAMIAGCLALTASGTMSAAADGSPTVDVACVAGFYDNGSGCVPADPGYFVALDGAIAQTACPIGKYQPDAGAASCIDASAGYYVDFAGASSQSACPAGRYQPWTGAATCITADIGYYVPTSGAVAQLACQQGYFQASPGAITCDAAPPGFFVNTTAATAATPCLAGTYQPSAGAATCITADAGYYVPSSGAVTQLACQQGYFQASLGGITCDAAPPGFFVNTTAATAATPCPAGTYQPLSGASMCVRAEPGFYVPNPGSASALACPPGTTSGVGATSCQVAVYSFSGFGAPVDAAPTLNSAKAGRTIPLKFRVTTATGAPVTNLTSVKVTVASSSCTAGTTVDAIEEYASGGSGLQNLGNGSYQFNWATPSGYAQSCKTLNLDLGDGVARQALFHFTR